MELCCKGVLSVRQKRGPYSSQDDGRRKKRALREVGGCCVSVSKPRLYVLPVPRRESGLATEGRSAGKSGISPDSVGRKTTR